MQALTSAAIGNASLHGGVLGLLAVVVAVVAVTMLLRRRSRRRPAERPEHD